MYHKSVRTQEKLKKDSDLVHKEESTLKKVIGFGSSEPEETPEVREIPAETVQPKLSLVSVRFESGHVLTYIDDSIGVKPGDRVFVDGTRAGKIGVVERVTTKFKVPAKGYKQIIGKASAPVRGTYEAVGPMMVSEGDGMTPEEFRCWILPPEDTEEPEEMAVGDGYEIDVREIEDAEGMEEAVMERAFGLCRDRKVAYLTVRGGIGTAFVIGTKWYRVDFRLDGEVMTEVYCDCPCPWLCKHEAAVAMTVRALQNAGIRTDRDFTAVDAVTFWGMAASGTKKITL